MINIEKRDIQKGYSKMHSKGSICTLVNDLTLSFPSFPNQPVPTPTVTNSMYLFPFQEFFLKATIKKVHLN